MQDMLEKDARSRKHNYLGGVEEEDWYESEIQAALLDEFLQHLENLKFRFK